MWHLRSHVVVEGTRGATASPGCCAARADLTVYTDDLPEKQRSYRGVEQGQQRWLQCLVQGEQLAHHLLSDLQEVERARLARHVGQSLPCAYASHTHGRELRVGD